MTMENEPLAKGMWHPIAQYNFSDSPIVLLAAFIEPSDYACTNGQKPFWDYGFGRCWSQDGLKFTGILGGSPSHFMLIEPPEAK